MADLPPLTGKRLDLGGVKTFDLQERRSKVHLDTSAKPWRPGGRLRDFLSGLPRELAGRDFRAVAAALVQAGQENRTVILGMGAHVIKVGLSPLIIDLISRRLLSGLLLNGAGVIHDTELALVGRTSEEVAEELESGRFGMARQTGEGINLAVARGAARGLGLGAAVGEWLIQERPPHLDRSILAAARQAGLPVMVFVAMGTDIIHMHPSMDPAATGLCSHRDFRTLAGLVAGLEGGVYLNLGSAVILPEVFLKALSLARNLGHRVERITTVNMDFINHYRPLTNVVRRPTSLGGQGYSLIGHHELMFPLLTAAWLEGLEGQDGGER